MKLYLLTGACVGAAHSASLYFQHRLYDGWDAVINIVGAALIAAAIGWALERRRNKQPESQSLQEPPSGA